jgi:hypothetical protein
MGGSDFILADKAKATPVAAAASVPFSATSTKAL